MRKGQAVAVDGVSRNALFEEAHQSLVFGSQVTKTKLKTLKAKKERKWKEGRKGEREREKKEKEERESKQAGMSTGGLSQRHWEGRGFSVPFSVSWLSGLLYSPKPRPLPVSSCASQIAIATPSSRPTNLANPVERKYLFLMGSRKTSEADPHWPIINHMPILEPIAAVRARLYALELHRKGLASSSKISSTEGRAGWFLQRKIWILLPKEVGRNAQKACITEVHQRKWQSEIRGEKTSHVKSWVGRNVPDRGSGRKNWHLKETNRRSLCLKGGEPGHQWLTMSLERTAGVRSLEYSSQGLSLCDKFFWRSFSNLLLFRFTKFLRFQLLCSKRDRLSTLKVAKHHIMTFNLKMLNAH